MTPPSPSPSPSIYNSPAHSTTSQSASIPLLFSSPAHLTISPLAPTLSRQRPPGQTSSPMKISLHPARPTLPRDVLYGQPPQLHLDSAKHRPPHASG